MNPSPPAGERYTLTVAGGLSPAEVDWPCQLETQTRLEAGAPRTVTILTLTVPDQPALHGLLEKIRDLNLKLISVQQVGPAP